MNEEEFRNRLILALEAIARNLENFNNTDGAGSIMIATREAI